MEHKDQFFRVPPVTEEERRLGLTILKVGRSRAHPDYRRSTLHKTLSTLKVIVAGHGYIKTPAGIFPFKAGDVLLYWQGHSYDWWTHPQELLQHYWVDMEGDMVYALFNTLATPTHCVVARDTLPDGEIDLFEQLIDLHQKQATYPTWKIISIFFAIWQSVTQSVRQPDQTAGSPVRYAKAFIDMHYVEDIKLADIARHVHVTTGYLVTLFKQQYGITPYDYVLECRIQAAKRLLQEGLSVKVAASSVGYSDANYFTRLYQKRTGRLPSDPDGSRATRRIDT